MSESVWVKTVEFENREALTGDIKTDVCIIGGGIAGILTAYLLSKKGVESVIIEENRLGMGVTQNTTAKITSQHNLIYDQLIKDVGPTRARQYLNANEAALMQYKELAKGIDCDFGELPNYVYSLTNPKKIEKEVKAVNSLGKKAEFVDKINLPFPVAYAIRFNDQAQFNPLKFLKAIVKDLKVYEQTTAKDIKKNLVLTDRGNITADKIVIATHFPMIDTHGFYFMKLYQDRSYVIALENAQDVEGMYIDEAENGLSFRNYKNLMFLGGGNHRTGKPGECFDSIRAFAKNHYAESKEVFSWATQDCMSLDKIPYIGQYSTTMPGIYVATGFNKWGMTSSMVSAMILSDRILDAPNEYAEVFSPRRSMMKKQLAVNLMETASNFFSFSTKRCSHLGCSLKWNPKENSWDCPCHGSRFDENGKLLNTPAEKGTRVK